MKTYKVVDLIYHEHEDNIVFTGTYQECMYWMGKQGFGYKLVPITKEELELENTG